MCISNLECTSVLITFIYLHKSARILKKTLSLKLETQWYRWNKIILYFFKLEICSNWIWNFLFRSFKLFFKYNFQIPCKTKYKIRKVLHTWISKSYILPLLKKKLIWCKWLSFHIFYNGHIIIIFINVKWKKII